MRWPFLSTLLLVASTLGCGDDVVREYFAWPRDLSVRTDFIEIDIDGTTEVGIEVANLSENATIVVAQLLVPMGIDVGDFAPRELAPGDATELRFSLTVNPAELAARTVEGDPSLTLSTNADTREISIRPYYDTTDLVVVGAVGTELGTQRIVIPETAPGAETEHTVEILNPTGRRMVITDVGFSGSTDIRANMGELFAGGPFLLGEEPIFVTFTYTPSSAGTDESVLILTDPWEMFVLEVSANAVE